MAIPRRILVVAATAVVGVAALAIRNRMHERDARARRDARERSSRERNARDDKSSAEDARDPVDEIAAAKDKLAREHDDARAREHAAASTTTTSASTSSASSSPSSNARGAAKPADAVPVPDEAQASVATTAGATGEGGAARELALFLCGDAWHDEIGWQALWEREGIDDAGAWMKTRGVDVLRRERRKLQDAPALLAGCRRRWIVAARYAGLDAADALALWARTDDAARG